MRTVSSSSLPNAPPHIFSLSQRMQYRNALGKTGLILRGARASSPAWTISRVKGIATRTIILCASESGSSGGSRGSGGGDRGKKKKGQQPDDASVNKWTKHAEASLPSAAAAAAGATVDTARKMQDIFCTQTSTSISRFGVDTGIQARVMHLYLKGLLELQHVYCEAKIAQYALLRRRGIRSRIPPSSSPQAPPSSSTIESKPPSSPVSPKMFLPKLVPQPMTLVLQDIQHLLVPHLFELFISAAIKGLPSPNLTRTLFSPPL